MKYALTLTLNTLSWMFLGMILVGLMPGIVQLLQIIINSLNTWSPWSYWTVGIVVGIVLKNKFSRGAVHV